MASSCGRWETGFCILRQAQPLASKIPQLLRSEAFLSVFLTRRSPNIFGFTPPQLVSEFAERKGYMAYTPSNVIATLTCSKKSEVRCGVVDVLSEIPRR